MLDAPHPSSLCIKIQYIPMCPIQATNSSCGFSLIHRGAGRKCPSINTPGSSPQPMIDACWSFHFHPSGRTTLKVYGVLGFPRVIETQPTRAIWKHIFYWLLPFTCLMFSFLYPCCLGSATIPSYCKLIIVSGLAFRRVQPKTIINTFRKNVMYMISWMGNSF